MQQEEKLEVVTMKLYLRDPEIDGCPEGIIPMTMELSYNPKVANSFLALNADKWIHATETYRQALAEVNGIIAATMYRLLNPTEQENQ